MTTKTRSSWLLNNNIRYKSGMGVNDLLRIIINYSVVLFIIAVLADTIFYIEDGKTSLIIINALTTIVILSLHALYKKARISANLCTVLIMITAALCLNASIIAETILSARDVTARILTAMFACVIPAMLAGLTSAKLLPYIITIGSSIVYAWAGIYLDNCMLLESLPTMTIIMAGAAIAFSNLFRLTRLIENNKIKMQTEQELVMRFLNLDPKHLEMIKEGKMTRQESLALLNTMDKTAQEKLMHKLKNLAFSEEEIKRIIRRQHPDLTPSELQICCHIVEGSSVTEISRLRGVGISTVTSTRSRLRTKLGLTKEDNLQDYLHKLMYGAKHRVRL